MDTLVYDVPVITQPDELTCWAATIAMVASASLSDGTFYTPQQVIDWADPDGTGRFAGPVGWSAIREALTRWGLEEIAPASWLPVGWADLLRERGPLGVVLQPGDAATGIYHAVVLCGIDGDGEATGTEMIINDPRPVGGGRRRLSFVEFDRQWGLGAGADAMIIADPAFRAPATGDGPTQDEFTRLLDAAPISDVVDGPGPIDAEPLPGGVIAGEVTDAVNAGVTLVKLVANSATVQVDRTRVARALPASVMPEALTDWAGPRRVARRYRTPDSPWWEVWNAEYDFTVGVQFLFNGRRSGVPGQYLDDILVFLEVTALPADFSITATAHFPTTCHMFGGAAPVAGMPFGLDVEVRYFFGQAVGWSRTLSFNVFGDGRAEIL